MFLRARGTGAGRRGSPPPGWPGDQGSWPPAGPPKLTSSSHRLCLFRASCSRLSHFFRFLLSSDSCGVRTEGSSCGKAERPTTGLLQPLTWGLTSCCTLCCFSVSPRTTGGFSTSSWGVACKCPEARAWHLRTGPQGSLLPAQPVCGTFPPIYLTVSQETPAQELCVWGGVCLPTASRHLQLMWRCRGCTSVSSRHCALGS